MLVNEKGNKDKGVNVVERSTLISIEEQIIIINVKNNEEEEHARWIEQARSLNMSN
jgi:hypothetical protein